MTKVNKKQARLKYGLEKTRVGQTKKGENKRTLMTRKMLEFVAAVRVLKPYHHSSTCIDWRNHDRPQRKSSALHKRRIRDARSV